MQYVSPSSTTRPKEVQTFSDRPNRKGPKAYSSPTGYLRCSYGALLFSLVGRFVPLNSISAASPEAFSWLVSSASGFVRTPFVGSLGY